MAEVTPHRFNRGFTWRSVPRLGGLATAEQCDAYDRDGFVLVEGVLDVDEVTAVREVIDGMEERKHTWLRERGESVYDISAPTRSRSPS